MYRYGLEPAFWLKLVMLIVIVLLLWVSLNTIMRKWLHVERQKFFSYNHVNEKHKNIDWVIRITTMISILIGYGINITREVSNWYWFLQPWFILIIYVIASQISRAVMERKYAQNPNAYKVTISEILFLLILYFMLFKTDFLGLI
ncbi:DUF4181 domain-containing protein [Aquibacillus rhizosphaerae]|uniref:DUF4181 domain-containing protein n=1 Tax=Aquibacillus rhizosphaerae TaxID=3051431 RepID=A0ABT7L0T1_9BACI|nr:DUF4181 domain-containing protein [Aquibacillus sp. LR5S19]MDL4839448.1 DUF4181 domain-containing protein [Aquibacillus sp. LR5S19]